MGKIAAVILIGFIIFLYLISGTQFPAHGTDSPTMICRNVNGEKNDCTLYFYNTNRIKMRVYYNNEWILTDMVWPNELVDGGEIIVK